MTINELDERLTEKLKECLKRKSGYEERELFSNASYLDGYIQGIVYAKKEFNEYLQSSILDSSEEA